MLLPRFLIVAILISFSTISTSFAQSLDHVQGEILIHLDERVDANDWSKEFSATSPYKIGLKKRISPILDLYVIGFDFTKINEERLLLSLLRDKAVYMAQYNHFVSLRSTIPDDPQFGQQWQYINDGQDGGTVGADIDMDLAWDFTTGGVTANGDTIVACVIDDGVDGTHPDMIPNLFINHAEIPGNNIDDDNNGFVDDYRGWDTGSDSDAVYDGGGHGTPVAGIVGAKGNNGIGVAGVNWDVKVMIVQGGTGVESEVIEAYSYPLSFRKKYNETNGAEGAFVVSTNASWGIDFGQPSDAPLWCAFYDTLGQHGILNCGATINGNQNVDEIGDLPTACASDYMISVTNMNRNDVKVTGAGYGLETIDLGAFGAETWTAAFGGNYGGFGGTSGATPHVTGTIALMYSAPCTNIADLALSDPEEAAKIMRTALFNGVDPNESLEGITVTGGRLNVHKALEQLITNNCGDCPPPLAGAVQDLSESSASLNWSLNDSINTTDLRWRMTGSTDWNFVENASSPYVLDGLEACTEYEYQLKAYCNLDTTDYGLIQTFLTAGCCENPENLETSNVTADQATISWDLAEYAISYNVRYKQTSSTDWIELNTENTFFMMDDLENCSEYEFQVQSVCNLASPDYTPSVLFFTKGCADACTQLPYCDVQGFDSDEEWIALMQLGNFENESNSDGGYGYYLDLSGPAFIKGGTYDISLTPGYSGQEYDEYFIVWIDYNEDGVFADDEIAFDSDGSFNSTITGEITLPNNVDIGNTRMRVAMRFENEPPVCPEENFNDFGEVEDYCISFGCPTVQSIQVDTTDLNSANITIVGDANADSQGYRYRKLGDTEWTEETSINLNILISDLEKCTEYEIQARTNCTDEQSEYSDIITFKTACDLNVEGENENQQLTVQPNPFNENIQLKINSIQGLKQCDIIVYNNIGEAVYTMNNVDFSAGENAVQVQLEDLVSGLYIVQIRNEHVNLSKKVIKAE